MNATAIRTAGKYFAIWGAIGASVALLSVIFNILGTITAAILVGMMLGAFKGPRSLSISVSLLFPAIILGLAQSARVGLAQRQLILLVTLCFGAFWTTYLVSACVFFCEQRAKLSPTLPGPVPLPATLTPPEPAAAIECAAALNPPAAESCLAQLDGDWVSVGRDAAKPPGKKVLQIKQARLELKAVDATGHLTLLACGDVNLRPAPAWATPPGAPDPADFIIGL